jgi:GDP-4-dehydro-6-deoxy-D-mannose reductase
VTGADGFVGRHLVAAWRESLPEAEIWGLVHEKKTVNLPTPFVCAFDLRDARGLYERCREIAPDWVVHLAAQSFVPRAFTHPQETWEVNFWGTFHLLEALREAHFTGRFLFVGSAEQYGKVEVEHLPIRESLSFCPRNAYAASKAAAELLCYQYCQSYELDVVLARPFNHIGPEQSPRFVVADFARQVARIERGLQPPLLLVGNLEVTRDFLDVRDVVAAYRDLLEKGKTGEAYNVCSGREVLLSDLVQTLVGLTAQRIEVRVDPLRFRPVDTSRMWGSHTKLSEHTGWRPKKELTETLREVFTSWKEAPDS